jgi:imidazole glycerol-phosphate synthase subunit HisF
MVKKRLVGVVTVKNGWAVQSYGYRRYLPLGKPECIVENLCRWGADEIIVQVIDRDTDNSGPDFQLLTNLAEIGLETPLIYGGGIRTTEEGIKVIQSGADRLSLDSLLHDNLTIVYELADKLGRQALIPVMPMSFSVDELLWLDYRNKASIPMTSDLLRMFTDRVVSEILLVDWMNEGVPNSFDVTFVEKFPSVDLPLIVFGGISEHQQMIDLLRRSNISAVAIGNFLNYREHTIQKFKEALVNMPVRSPIYKSSNNA